MRLAFEYAGVPYAEELDAAVLVATIGDPAKAGSPPHLAPPALKLPSGKFLSQTSVILDYLAPRLGLAGKKEGEDPELLRGHVTQLLLTIMDLSTEVNQFV